MVQNLDLNIAIFLVMICPRIVLQLRVLQMSSSLKCLQKSENVIKDIQFDENTEILRLEQAGPIKKSSKNFYTSNQKEDILAYLKI